MSKINAEWIEEKAKECYALLDDGFQWTDLFTMLPKIVEIAEQLDDLSEEERKEVAVELADHIIDETDTPWVPDSLVDPILKKAMPYLVDMAFNTPDKK